MKEIQKANERKERDMIRSLFSRHSTKPESANKYLANLIYYSQLLESNPEALEIQMKTKESLEKLKLRIQTEQEIKSMIIQDLIYNIESYE